MNRAADLALAPDKAGARVDAGAPAYRLDDQVGFLLRQVQQRHALIFASGFGEELTTTQWAVLAKLAEVGECSQNLLGRLVAMDVATIKGVVERLGRRDLVALRADPSDRRRVLVGATQTGADLYEALVGRAREVTEETLAPLRAEERETLIGLLRRMR